MSRRRSGMKGGDGTGRLVVIGGTDHHGHESHEAVLEHFVELAGGSDAHIVIIAAASESPGQREGEYADVFKRLGAGRVEPLRMRRREDANSEASVTAVSRATGVYFTGGDELRLANVIGGSRVGSALHNLLNDGLVIAGAGAGAAMMSGTVIIGGSETVLRMSTIRTGPGMDFVPGILVDIEFAERGRLNRLLNAIAMYPHQVGLGIDENTGIVVDGDRFEVVGTGSVTVIDAGPASTINAVPADGGPVALCGARMHVLPAGYAYQLIDRQAVVASATAPEGATPASVAKQYPPPPALLVKAPGESPAPAAST